MSPLSAIASRALGQAPALPAVPAAPVAPAIPTTLIYVTTGTAAALGLVSNLIPKKQKTLKNATLGGSVAALALTAGLFLFSK